MRDKYYKMKIKFGISSGAESEVVVTQQTAKRIRQDLHLIYKMSETFCFQPHKTLKSRVQIISTKN